MLEFYPKANPEYDNDDLLKTWEKYMAIRDLVSKKLELARANKEIGLSLEAKVTLYAEGDEYELIKGKEEFLKELFIVSEVIIEQNRRNEDEEVSVGVKVENAEGEKCERCWMISKTVGKNLRYPTLCDRCVKNIE